MDHTENLLDEIIAATVAASGKEMIRVDSVDALLNVARVMDMADEKEAALSLIERYHFETYGDLIEVAGFLFRKLFHLFQEGFLFPGNRKQELFKRRLWFCLNAFEVDTKNAEACLYAHLVHRNGERVQGAVHILSSIHLHGGETPFLDRVIAAFAGVEDSYLPCFVNGLRFGRHPQIEQRVTLLLEMARPVVQKACLDILRFRRELKREPLIRLMDSGAMDVKIKAACILAMQNDQKSLSFLEEHINHALQSELEEVLFALMVRSVRGGELFRGVVSEGKRLSKEILVLFAVSVGRTDLQALFAISGERASGHRVDALEALGMTGNVAGIPFLVRMLSGDDDAVRQAAAKSLVMITGAPLKERYDHTIDIPGGRTVHLYTEERACTDPERWQAWWDQNRSLFDEHQVSEGLCFRKGKVWDMDSMADTLLSPDASYAERKTAFRELVIRTGRYLHFEPGWSPEIQVAAVERIKREMGGHSQ